jgi:hypothetical protein
MNEKKTNKKTFGINKHQELKKNTSANFEVISGFQMSFIGEKKVH